MGEYIVTGMPLDLLLVRHGHSEGNRALESAEEGDVRLHQDRRFRARWRRISRPRFSNDDLLAQVERHPHLWDDDAIE